MDKRGGDAENNNELLQGGRLSPSNQSKHARGCPAIPGALLEYGGHVAIAVALASFGVLATTNPAFSLSWVARVILYVVCFGGAILLVAASAERLYRGLAPGKPIVIWSVLAVVLAFGMAAVLSVVELARANRVAAVCERAEREINNAIANSGRCKFYYMTRDAADRSMIFD